MNITSVTAPVVGSRAYSLGGKHGSVTAIEKPYMTMDQLLCTIRWDDGETIKLYDNDFVCLGPFRSLADFQTAICQTAAEAKLTLGPNGGFRGFEMTVQCDGTALRAFYGSRDGAVFRSIIEPSLKSAGKIPETVQLERRPKMKPLPKSFY